MPYNIVYLFPIFVGNIDAEFRATHQTDYKYQKTDYLVDIRLTLVDDVFFHEA